MIWPHLNICFKVLRNRLPGKKPTYETKINNRKARKYTGDK